MERRPDKKTAKAQARPFAKAAFEQARDEKRLGDWEEKLMLMAEVVKHPDVDDILRDPRLPKASLYNVMNAMMDKLEVTQEQRNFFNLMIDKGKLSLAPWVYDSFVETRKKAENKPDVTVISAIELTELQVQNLKETLSKRFNAKSEPTLKVDPDLIGGIKIIIGDRVYDQTVKGQLERLKKHLKGP